MTEADWKHPHTFEEALQYIREEHWIDYEVLIDGHQGALLTRKDWLEEVRHQNFVDYDGYGSQLTTEGKFLTPFCIGGDIRPSTAAEILTDTAYILWYNR